MKLKFCNSYIEIIILLAKYNMKSKNVLIIAFFLVANTLYGQKNDNNHTFLGVDVDSKPSGLYVNGVYKGYSAEKAGLKCGDILLKINSTAVNSFVELVNTLDKYEPGQQVTVSIMRKSVLQKLTATLSAYPDFLKYPGGKESEQSKVQKASLGLFINSDWEKYAVSISSFQQNSSAKKAGLETGDIILKMDTYQFATMEELQFYLSKYKVGDVVTLEVQRDEKVKEVTVVLNAETNLKNKTEKERSN